MSEKKFSPDIVTYIHCSACIELTQAGKPTHRMAAGYTATGMLQLWCEEHGASLGIYNVSDASVKIVT